MIKKIKRAIVECLGECLREHPQNIGMGYPALDKKVKLKVEEPELPGSLFGQALSELMVDKKIVLFGAVRQAYMAFRLIEP